MRRTLILFWVAIPFLFFAGCESKAPVKEKTTVSAVSQKVSQKGVEKTVDFMSKVTPLAGSESVDDLRQRDAIRKYYTGLKLRSEGKQDDAVNSLLAAIKIDPQHLSARYQLAVTLAQKKDATNALAVLAQFRDAKDCSRCYVMLAKAKDNDAFNIFKDGKTFRDIVEGAAERFEKELLAADWVSYSEDALEKKKVELTFKGIPAISADGKRILAANLGRDKDGRVYSATLLTMDAGTGDRIRGKSILFRSEGERLITGRMHYRETMLLLNDRIAHVHEALVSEKWTPMAVAAAATDETLKSCGAAQKMNVLDRIVTLADMQLKVTDAEGNSMVNRDAKSLLPVGNEVCATTVMIRNIYTVPSHRSLLLELSYCSSSCRSRQMKWTALRY